MQERQNPPIASEKLVAERTITGASTGPRFNLRWVLIVTAVCALPAVIVPSVRLAMRSRQQMKCDANLRMIAESLDRYRMVEGSYPPPTIFDANGLPLHSWRVLIVPFIEKNWLASAYVMEEPWNGRHNQLFHQECFEETQFGRRDITKVRDWFVSPSSLRPQSPYCTNYVMVVETNEPSRPLEFWPGVGMTPGWQQNVPAGKSLMVIGICRSNIHWLEPRDLSIEQILLLDADQQESTTQIVGAIVLGAKAVTVLTDHEAAVAHLKEMLEARKAE